MLSLKNLTNRFEKTLMRDLRKLSFQLFRDLKMEAIRQLALRFVTIFQIRDSDHFINF